jgi:hypothetical protein
LIAAHHDARQGNIRGSPSFEHLSPGRDTKGLKIRFESHRNRGLRAFFDAFRGGSKDPVVMAGLKREGVRSRAEPQVLRLASIAQDDKL